MNNNVLGDFFVFLIYFVPFLGLLCVTDLIIEYIVPHIPFLNRWVEKLIGDDFEDNEK